MPNLNDYIRDYGNIPFEEKPFTDEDNVALVYVQYMMFEKVVSDSFDDEPVKFADACKDMFIYRGCKHKPVGLVLLKNISVQMMEMAKSKRFSEMKIVACTDVFDSDPAIQFNAATFLLPNGEIVVMYRGTDDTLIGWQEDFDAVCKGKMASEPYTIAYIEEVAKRFEGDIIVCGHSKGGYLAQCAALNCSPETRKRIKKVYNNDGPGFANYDYLDGEAYNELLEKYTHYIPQSSFIGMMLCHDDDYTVVKSSRILGPMEHDAATWQIKNGKLVTLPDITDLARISDLLFFNIVKDINEYQKKTFDAALDSIIKGVGYRGLLDVKNHAIKSVKGAVDGYRTLDRYTKDGFKSTLRLMGRSLKKSVKTVKSGRYQSVRQRISR